MFKPKDVPQLSPYLTVRDSAKSIDFYTKAFGFTLKDAVKNEKGIIEHTEMRMQDVFIMFSPEGAYGSKKKAPVSLGIEIPLNLYIYCENVDELYKQAINHGAKSIMEPFDSFWGDRYCCVADPDGYEWGFGMRLNNK
jgi:uncharacterized glyoxalase superfamily protein PhnB